MPHRTRSAATQQRVVIAKALDIVVDYVRVLERLCMPTHSLATAIAWRELTFRMGGARRRRRLTECRTDTARRSARISHPFA